MILLNIPEFFGISIEVYIFLILVGIPMFFFWRWLLGKFIKTAKRRKIVTWILTVISAPLIYAGVIMIWLLSVSYYPKHDFEKKGWFTDTLKRYEYSGSIIESKMLIGKTKDEVCKTLGEPDYRYDKDKSDEWRYYLGFRPDLYNIDPDHLLIDFEKGKVTDVRQIAK